VSGEPSLKDPSLPRLEVATDPERMRGIFQEHLRPLDGKAYRVLECRISYMRHREGRRCMLHYDLRLREIGAEREWSQLVTGTIYAGGRTRQFWERLRRPDPGPATPAAAPSFEPFFYISDLDMLAQVFPYDRRLPTLPLLLEGPPPELEPLLLARFGRGGWRVRAWNAELVRYRVGLRATLRLAMRARDATTGRAEERRFYAKVYSREEEGEQAYRVLGQLWDVASAGTEGFTVGRPIAYLSNLRTLIQGEVTGTPLNHVLLRGTAAVPVVGEVAKALAALHLGDVVPPRFHRLQDEVARLERAGNDLRSAYPHLVPEIEEIIGAVVAGLEDVPPRPTHGELRPMEILVGRDRLALLDLDTFAGADPVLDVARLLLPLARTVPLRSPSSHDRAQEAARIFVDEYFARVPEEWRARLPLHYAGAALKRAAASVRHRAPDWIDEVEGLLNEARDSLGGRIW
jgi:aminoglycoside phosphotransferase (APT) family kinase protein